MNLIGGKKIIGSITGQEETADRQERVGNSGIEAIKATGVGDIVDECKV